MVDFHFHLPTKVVFGCGRIKELQNMLNPGITRILLVTDKHVAKKSGALDAILPQLTDKEVILFDKCEPNPPFRIVDIGKEFAQKNRSQIIIGIGGGSAMDTAKGIAVLAGNDWVMKNLFDNDSSQNNALPIVCIPTTSGTGSEVTPYAVFTDLENQNKCGYYHPEIFPRLSIIDPELSFSMPEPLIIDTGLDALTHAIEAFLSTLASPLTDELAFQAINIILKNLKPASEKEEKAMIQLSYASLIAGIAIANAGTILLHIMAYPLTVFHRISHGRANAILLPGFLDFMKRKSTVKSKLSRLEKYFKEFKSMETFITEFKISPNLSTYGIKEEEIHKFVKKTIVKSDIRITPAHITEGDITNIYLSHLRK